jgi:hypothetical protein
MSFFSSLSQFCYDSCRYFIVGVAGNCSVPADITQLKTLQTVDLRPYISKDQATLGAAQELGNPSVPCF